MTQVDFYVLSAASIEARLGFAARLGEKILNGRHQLVIATPNADLGQQLSEQLWHLRPDAFIAHSLVDETSQQNDPVLVCQTTPPAHCHDVLINLTDTLLEHCFSRFNRVVEIVVQEPSILAQTREAYQFYKARSYPIRTHRLDV
ncbi:DNA polymerase III subunit chi [Halioxenophilus aromaticivorans]|uniref:DNA polymerase III subunit chi n=1 Tax=Halioxenophilus aromaticivorans TaxID=1306992 RepID=A0AAV3U0Z2_9ALTE